MQTKQETTRDDLLFVIKLLEQNDVKYLIDGGWGVDILAGRQTRAHRDIDVDFDASKTDALLDILEQAGYEITTDWRPVRIELYSIEHGYLDIHPFLFDDKGGAKQADLNGGQYEFEASYFTAVSYQGLTVPCISTEGQKVFHSGYEQREKDKHDLLILQELSSK